MKNIINEHVPFEHKDLEYINNSLNLARTQRLSKTLEGMMSATLIYTNLVEYLADNLLENLHHMIYLASYRDFQGTFFMKNQDAIKSEPPKPLGKLINSLGHYEFSDSTGFLKLLEEFSKKRNKIFHRLLKVSKEEISGIDTEFVALHDMAEEVLNKYNAITTGTATVWNNFSVRHRADQTIEEKDLLIKQLQEQVSAQEIITTDLQAKLQAQPIILPVKKIIKKKKIQKKK